MTQLDESNTLETRSLPERPRCEMKFLTIGIRGSGPGAGKDTAADYLAEELTKIGMRVRRERFATPIRECIQAMTGISVEESQTTEGKNRFYEPLQMTVGQLLVQVGDTMRRSMYENVWVDGLFNRFKPNDFVIISDVRLKNEQNAVRLRKGIVLAIDSVRAPTTEQLAGRNLDHLTERGLDGIECDYRIVNDGDLNELKRKLDIFIESLTDGCFTSSQ